MKPINFHALAVVMALAAITAPINKLQASVYQTFNEGQPKAPFFWQPSSIGWYWTPATDVELAGIQTQLTSGFSNINNNFTFTTELFTDRPAAGGTSLGSFTWNGVTFVDGPWLGGSFSSPISLTGGVTYFVGMSGWENALGWNGPNSGAGVNWTSEDDPAIADHVGLLSSYGDASGAGPHEFDTQWNGTNPAVPIVTEFPFLRFIAADPTDPGSGAVPEFTSVVSFGLLFCFGAVANVRRRRRTKE